jgi:hypothetical protein
MPDAPVGLKARPQALPRWMTTLLAVTLAAPCSVAGRIELPRPVDLDPKIETLLAPLSSMPAIQRGGEALKVEIEPGAAAEPATVEAALMPSFGRVRLRISLGKPVGVDLDVGSRLWPDRRVDRLSYALPADLLPDLYDLEVGVPGAGLLSAGSGTDQQRRAVSIVAGYPAAPRVVVIADPSVGDPRPVLDAALDAIQRGEIEQALEFLQRSIGNPITSERWAALARVIREVNLVRPDFVLVTGDLTFLLHARALPYEYEDAWRLLDRLEVPAFLTPGNHDLYAIDDYLGDTEPIVDGRYLWLQYFGPLHYSVDIGSALHLASINTFDWPSLAPFALDAGFDTVSGGQVLAPQLAWLESDLRAYRARAPDGMLLTIAHHDPSWIQRRHPWSGEGRLELRDLLAATRVGAHFSGHTHEDRVARYVDGDIVETNGRPHVDQPVQQLHYVKRDDSLDQARTQEQLGAILRSPESGPLFVSTTTAASQLVGEDWGLGGYWGWRLVDLRSQDSAGGFDPASFGYPVTRAFLDRRAERPENWTEEHAQFGLFSYPSFELDQEITAGNNGTARESEMLITSRLLADLDIVPRLTVAAADRQPLRAEGGEVQKIRYGEGRADVWVRARVPAESALRVRVGPEHESPEPEPATPTVPAPADNTRFGGGLSLCLIVLLMTAALARIRISK